jgi:hypothetical protein
MVRKRLIVIVALFPCASLRTAAGQDLDALIWSTARGGGAIEVEYDFGGKVRVVDSLGFCPGGTCRYVSTNPGFRTPQEDQPPRFALDQGVPIALEIVALDAGVSVKIGSSILNAPGTRAMLGTAPSLHVHPEWQLVIPEGERGDYEVSFRLTSGTASYDPSRAYSLTLTNATGATPATTATPTPTRAGRPHCPGDCNGDGAVAVNELVAGASILLTMSSAAACPVFDADGNDRVSIDELLSAVHVALQGCETGDRP